MRRAGGGCINAGQLHVESGALHFDDCESSTSGGAMTILGKAPAVFDETERSKRCRSGYTNGQDSDGVCHSRHLLDVGLV